MAAITRFEAAMAGALPSFVAVLLLLVVSCSKSDVYIGSEKYDRLLDDSKSYGRDYSGRGDITLNSKIFYIENKSQKSMEVTIEDSEDKYLDERFSKLAKASRWRHSKLLRAGEKDFLGFDQYVPKNVAEIMKQREAIINRDYDYHVDSETKNKNLAQFDKAHPGMYYFKRQYKLISSIPFNE